MSVIIQGTQLREIALGRYVQGKTSDITTGGAATYQLFTVAGGEVLITALWGKVTTAIAAAGATLNLQVDPTTGDTTVVATATDLGTSDAAAGTVLGVSGDVVPATSIVENGKALTGLVVTTGEIESVVTGTTPDGVVDWFCTWVPLTAGATVVAAA